MESYIDLRMHRAIIDLPENSIEIVVKAKIYDGGEIKEVSSVYDLASIREMFRKADDGYIDDDDVFTITDKGRKYLEELESE